MNQAIGAIFAGVLVLLLLAQLLHQAFAEPVHYRLLVIDTSHRLHLSEPGWDDFADCRVEAADLRRAAGVLYADCVVAEVGV